MKMTSPTEVLTLTRCQTVKRYSISRIAEEYIALYQRVGYSEPEIFG